MIFGKREHFTKAHFEANKGTAPAYLCELVVHCLELVAQLVQAGVQFRFKGGNSLLVLLEDPQRFSIDVDVVTTASKESLIAEVEKITAECELFTRYETRAPRTKPWLPMISFKLFFESQYQKPEDAFVMLDCVLEPPPYGGIGKLVRCGAIYTSDVHVEVPSISGLIGDKLLTIGPATLGIPLGRSKEAQRLKHVFDVSLLSRKPWDPAEVRASVVGCMAQENRIQGHTCTWEEVVKDTRAFLEAPSAHDTLPDLATIPIDGPTAYLHEIVKGFTGFRTHLFKIDYTWSLLRDDCARVLSLLDAVGSV